MHNRVGLEEVKYNWVCLNGSGIIELGNWIVLTTGPLPEWGAHGQKGTTQLGLNFHRMWNCSQNAEIGYEMWLLKLTSSSHWVLLSTLVLHHKAIFQPFSNLNKHGNPQDDVLNKTQHPPSGVWLSRSVGKQTACLSSLSGYQYRRPWSHSWELLQQTTVAIVRAFRNTCKVSLIFPNITMILGTAMSSWVNFTAGSYKYLYKFQR